MNVAHQEIDIFDPKRNEKMACFTKEERQSFSNFTKMGFIDSFRDLYPGKIKYSFWDIRDKSRKENKGWRLDYIMVSKQIKDTLVDADIHNEYWGSDHCPVSMTLDETKIDLEEFREMQKLSTSQGDDDDKSDLDMDDPLNEERKSDLEDDNLTEQYQYHIDGNGDDLDNFEDEEDGQIPENPEEEEEDEQCFREDDDDAGEGQ